MAAAVSHGVDGGDWREAAKLEVAAARLGASEGNWTVGADVAARIEWACALVRGEAASEAISPYRQPRRHQCRFSQESVPAAFAVVEVAEGDPWQAAVISANLGGDTDTIGAIAAGMAGACAGMASLPQEHVARLKGIDLNEVRALAADLVAARLRPASGKEAAA